MTRAPEARVRAVAASHNLGHVTGVTQTVELEHRAQGECRGSYASGFEPLARCFEKQLTAQEIGAGLSVYHRGEHVVNLWGGKADKASGRAWEHDSRVVLFSVTKGFMAMAMHLLSDRGLLDWDAPVAQYWPGFAAKGKGDITVRTLLNHRGGLPYIDAPLTLEQCTDPAAASQVLEALEQQAPAWAPEERQGYHAITFGMYARELFERIAGEPLGPFLRRELFEPLGSDVYVGAPAELDAKVATLYPPPATGRFGKMIASSLFFPRTTEARIAKATIAKASLQRRAFLNPSTGKGGPKVYNDTPVRRATLAWASATASADGVARAYLPFASGGTHDGVSYMSPETLTPVYRRQGWSEEDEVLMKPLGWSEGFLKEERHIFSPQPASFGHAGMGGALGWCDPVAETTFGYVMNRMDWRVRSERVVSLCRALYECEPIRER